MKRINYLSYIVTWKCNGRCKMCKIWRKIQVGRELWIYEVKKVFSDPIFDDLKEVIISGGEPFLREDLVDIIDQIYKSTRASIGVTTNGYLTKVIINSVKKLLSNSVPLSIYVSLDGSKPEVNDVIRGIKGFFKNTVETLSLLTQLKKQDSKLKIDVGLTVTTQNLRDILEVRKLVRSLDNEIGFGVRLAENADYFNNVSLKLNYGKEDKKYLCKVLDRLKDGKIDYYYRAIQEYIRTQKYPEFPCTALSSSAYLTPEGEIVPCGKYLERIKVADLKKETPKEAVSKMQIYKSVVNNCEGCLDPCQWSWANNSLAI